MSIEIVEINDLEEKDCTLQKMLVISKLERSGISRGEIQYVESCAHRERERALKKMIRVFDKLQLFPSY